MVWENIKGVINGGLPNIIKGLVNILRHFYTGDFSKMWEGVKNIFSVRLNCLRLIQLMFWGRIIKGITSFVSGGFALFRNFGTQTVLYSRICGRPSFGYSRIYGMARHE